MQGFRADAPWAIYGDIGTALTEPNPLAFGIVKIMLRRQGPGQAVRAQAREAR